jgi:hypothetical protein
MPSVSCLRGFKASLALFVALPALTTCSTTLTLPATATLETRNEAFTGIATDADDGWVNIAIKGTKGTNCTGLSRYIYTGFNGERSVLAHCDDGRSGFFSFVSTGDIRGGTGRLWDRPFTFNFG